MDQQVVEAIALIVRGLGGGVLEGVGRELASFLRRTDSKPDLARKLEQANSETDPLLLAGELTSAAVDDPEFAELIMKVVSRTADTAIGGDAGTTVRDVGPISARNTTIFGRGSQEQIVNIGGEVGRKDPKA